MYITSHSQLFSEPNWSSHMMDKSVVGFMKNLLSFWSTSLRIKLYIIEWANKINWSHFCNWFSFCHLILSVLIMKTLREHNLLYISELLSITNEMTLGTFRLSSALIPYPLWRLAIFSKRKKYFDGRSNNKRRQNVPPSLNQLQWND